ncbi:MAG: adenylate kinase [bacterium]|nr:adenylate kinase [bacterium]
MRVVFLGAPGAGKGTQARRIAERASIPQISTGDILRLAVREGTSLGLEAKAFMDRGELVPDSLMVGLIRDRIQQSDCVTGYLLDGFPRTLAQAEALDRMLEELDQPLQLAIELSVPDAELVRRLTGRRVCRSCGASFHVVSAPSRVHNVCDHCGGELYQRDDDAASTVERRLAVYHEQTAPISERYREVGILRELDGAQSIEALEVALERLLAPSEAR